MLGSTRAPWREARVSVSSSRRGTQGFRCALTPAELAEAPLAYEAASFSSKVTERARIVSLLRSVTVTVSV